MIALFWIVLYAACGMLCRNMAEKALAKGEVELPFNVPNEVVELTLWILVAIWPLWLIAVIAAAIHTIIIILRRR